DYVALGPIYPTLLKVMPWPAQGLERIAQWKRRIGTIPLVAIGGLTLERLPGVFAAGADVAAVVTDIVRHLDPEARVRQWLSASRACQCRAPGGSRGCRHRRRRQLRRDLRAERCLPGREHPAGERLGAGPVRLRRRVLRRRAELSGRVSRNAARRGLVRRGRSA